MPKKPIAKSRPTTRSAQKVGPKPAAKGHTLPAQGPKAPKPRKGASSTAKPATEPKRPPTRGDEVVKLLRRKRGATIAEMVTRFGLKPHSLRAVISIESRKRGLSVRLVGRGHYSIS